MADHGKIDRQSLQGARDALDQPLHPDSIVRLIKFSMWLDEVAVSGVSRM